MFKRFLQWGAKMAVTVMKAANRRARELPRVRLIAVVDPLSDGVRRKKEVQSLLATMFASVHQVGRPRKSGDQDKGYAA